MIVIGWLSFVAMVSTLTYWKNSEIVSERSKSGTSALWQAVYIIASVWLRHSRMYPLLIVQLPQLVRYCSLLHSGGSVKDPAFHWATKAFACSILLIIAAITAWLAQADAAMITVFMLLAAGSPMALWHDLTSKMRRRQEAFVSELPTFMHKLSLLIAAGETTQRAWQRAGTVDRHKAGHPLYAELGKTGNELAQGVPFVKALEDLHRRCGVHEVSVLVTTVLMNYRRGGDAFALSLQDASRMLMERKFAIVRMRGEEASTKLLFPMMLMLCAVMLVVAAPAIMMMS